MKIGLVLDTTLDSNAGVQQYFKGLARYLLSKKHKVKFLVPPSKDKGEFKGNIISFGREITVKGNANTIKTVFKTSRRRIRNILGKEEFDVIHISSPFSPFLGAKILRNANCPVVSTYLVYGRNSFYRLAGFFLSMLMYRVYKKIDKYIAPSFAAKKEAEFTMPGKYEVIPIGVDTTDYSPKVKPIEKYNNKTFNILFIGRLEKRKGVDYLIKAYKVVKDDYPNTRLIIVGKGPMREDLDKLVSDLDLNDVEFTGYIDEKDKPRYYATADICVFPAIYGESFGVVLIEAMASGKPTIAFRNEGYSFVLRNLQMLLVENKSIEKLVSKMIQFIKSKSLKKNYGMMCLEESRKYSWDSIGERIIKIYKGLNKDN